MSYALRHRPTNMGQYRFDRRTYFDGFVKVQYLRYARFLRICGLRLVNIHVRQVPCILRNRASLDLEHFTSASILNRLKKMLCFNLFLRTHFRNIPSPRGAVFPDFGFFCCQPDVCSKIQAVRGRLFLLPFFPRNEGPLSDCNQPLP